MYSASFFFLDHSYHKALVFSLLVFSCLSFNTSYGPCKEAMMQDVFSMEEVTANHMIISTAILPPTTDQKLGNSPTGRCRKTHK